MKIVRILLGTIAAFIALTAVGGGIAILTGVDEFPAEWLASTPFASYTIPALLLTGVGALAGIAGYAAFTKLPMTSPAAMLAGLLMAGYIVGELVLLKQPAPRPTPIEWIYLALGLLLAALGAGLGARPSAAARG